MMNRIEVSADHPLGGKVIEANIAQASRELEMGALGKILGGINEKPGNIAFIAITLAFLFLAAVLIWGDVSIKGAAMTLFGGIITGALGFLFGRTTST